MKIAEMKEIAVSYSNVVNFLYLSQIEKLKDAGIICHQEASFSVIAQEIIANYEAGLLSNREASELLTMIKSQSWPRTENYRVEGGKIYEYDDAAHGYVYHSKYSRKSLAELIAAKGRFFD